MGRAKKWYRLTVAVGLFTLFGWTCGTDMRDAVIAGAFDFVTGTVTSILTTLNTPPTTSA